MKSEYCFTALRKVFNCFNVLGRKFPEIPCAALLMGQLPFCSNSYPAYSTLVAANTLFCPSSLIPASFSFFAHFHYDFHMFILCSIGVHKNFSENCCSILFPSQCFFHDPFKFIGYWCEDKKSLSESVFPVASPPKIWKLH